MFLYHIEKGVDPANALFIHVEGPMISGLLQTY